MRNKEVAEYACKMSEDLLRQKGVWNAKVECLTYNSNGCNGGGDGNKDGADGNAGNGGNGGGNGVNFPAWSSSFFYCSSNSNCENILILKFVSSTLM